ncbi:MULTISPECIES: S-type pyocin domain-containing protein [Pseudomonas]|jgi:hypothetical protein|uniref:Pyosin/cloacin translocation domain-containing protein n=2 Tax=Pseudomonas TaxID=286 RepID=A0A4Y9TDU9_PSEFL|nr:MULTISPECIES: S-type pyocin domain-containing protein [Pseudomonas]CRM91175.1 Pyocin-S2 [Pseudomonas sp. 22 E 5]MCX9152964.1 S-type pyocin domain-containing protein [Pseudomonas sp. TB1-B1]QXH69766.1 S-type pyocin domain-containing protein [Pseudomonas asgharzadehiana]TFW42494.1 hypothetical protein E4T65_14535 [Pseudomonas fluorescens]TKJ59212.1 hypothetical protein PspCFBP13506_20075 [Pseudomonas sp. CFBP13506]
MSGSGEGPIELGLTEINAVNELPITIPGGIGSGGSGANATKINNEVRTIKAIDLTANKLIDTLDTHYIAEIDKNDKNLLVATEATLTELEGTAGTGSQLPMEKINLRLEAINKLTASKSTELEIQKSIVSAYFYKDPLTDTRRNVVGTFGTQLGRQGRDRNHASFIRSYQAAYAAKLIQAQIDVLNTQAAAARQALLEARQIQAANRFSVSGPAAKAGALLVTTAGTVISVETTTLSLRAAVSAAIAALNGLVASVGAGLIVGISALFYSPKLANGELPERYTFSTPLSDLLPDTTDDLSAIAAEGGTIDLPYRLSSKTAANGQSEVFVVKTDGAILPSRVNVLAATYDAQQNLYSVTTANTPPRTLTWTPIVEPGNNSSTTPAEQSEPAIYPGATVTPIEGRTDIFPGVVEASFDDFITVFPADSGIPPIYVMFKDRREDPGVVTGNGQPVTGNWLDAASRGEGAAIASQLADQLKGKEFKNFKSFRKFFWTIVSLDPVLSAQFKGANRTLIKNGTSPFTIPSEQVGGRGQFEIHHIIPVHPSGAVYDIDNMRIMTPRLHIQTHSKKGDQ